MSTYVVRFLDTGPEEFRGRVRHIGSGEEDNFVSPEDLYDFFERMNAAHGQPSEMPVGETDAGKVGGVVEQGGIKRIK